MEQRVHHWPSLVRHLRSCLGRTQAAFADRLGVDQATVSRWERGTQVPDLETQIAILDLSHRLEPVISRAFVEATPVIAIIYDMDTFGLCVAASQPLAQSYALHAREFRWRSMLDLWTPSIASAMSTLAESPEWKSGDIAIAKSKVLRRDGAWLGITYAPLEATGLCFANATVIDKPAHLAETDFELEIIPRDAVVV